LATIPVRELKVAEPADDAFSKKKSPPTVLIFIISPAVELLLKKIPPAKSPSSGKKNDCIDAELLTIPAPLKK